MSNPEFQHIRLNMVDGIALVEVITRDLKGPRPAKELGAELGQVLHREGLQRLVVDFDKNRYLSSSGFAVLFNLVNQVKAVGQEIKFCGMASEIRLGASVVGLDKVVEIHDTRDGAMRTFAQGQNAPP
jgi:anti-sigma B factor antagonist